MKIKDRTISRDGEPYLVGEIGNNHGGDVKRAIAMMSTLKAAGWHAAKLQKRTNIDLFTREMYHSAYTGRNAYAGTYGSHREALEFNKDEYRTLIAWAEEIGLHFFATAFDFRAADFLNDLNMPAFKMASGDITNTPLLRYVANFGRPMIISTGGATLGDVKRAVDVVLSVNEQLCVMQCTAAYPCPPEGEGYEVFNLSAIQTFRKSFQDVVVGFSDHQSGVALGPAALALGAVVFEKHVTFDRTAKGTDHPFSLEPVGQRKYARDIQRAYEAMGDGIKRPFDCEQEPLRKMAKSIVASRELLKGTKLAAEDVAYKAPSGGEPPYRIYEFIGRETKHHLVRDQMIMEADLE